MYCMNCGSLMSEHDKFCYSCGSKKVAKNNTKKIVGIMSGVFVVLLLVIGCIVLFGGTKEPTNKKDTNYTKTENDKESTDIKDDLKTDDNAKSSAGTDVIKGNKVGISLPSQYILRWINAGETLSSELQDLGYEVELYFAEYDIAKQNEQIKGMVDSGCSVIIVTPVEGSSLTESLEYAKEKGVKIISHQLMITNADAVSYYVSADQFEAGKKQAEYVIEKLKSNGVEKPYNIRIITEDTSGFDEKRYLEGIIYTLNEYSGTVNWEYSEYKAKPNEEYIDTIKGVQNLMDDIISRDNQIDAVLCANDVFAYSVSNSLDINYRGNVYPIVAGQDCDLDAVKRMLDGTQDMSVFINPNEIDETTVKLVDDIMNSREIDDRLSFDNGKGLVTACLCQQAECVDVNNCQSVLIDGGFYTLEDIFY